MHYGERVVRLFYPMVLLVILMAAIGCTIKQVQPEIYISPEKPCSAVALGDITIEDNLREYLIPFFRRGFVDRLKAKKAFETVFDTAPEALGESSVVVCGNITKIDKGSTALRWIVGFGAGKAKAVGDFEIRDSTGQILARFHGQESYLGGLGIGGAGFLDMEDLMRKFGETIADKTIQWSRGEKFESVPTKEAE